MSQLLEASSFFFSTLNHGHAFLTMANAALIHSQMLLQWRNSFKQTHKSICSCVWEYSNTFHRRPFFGLMRNIPWVMGLAASEMGNPYLLRGVIRGLGGEEKFVPRMCDFVRRKFFLFLLLLECWELCGNRYS